MFGRRSHPAWPQKAVALATGLLSSSPRSSCSATASELLRRLNFRTNRASVRSRAIDHRLAPDTRFKSPPSPSPAGRPATSARSGSSGSTTPPRMHGCQTVLKSNRSSTSSTTPRVSTSPHDLPARRLLSHLDFLSCVFLARGFPLALHVDFHSFFFTHAQDALTHLGTALHFTASPCASRPPRRQKAKSNAVTTAGKNVSRPCSPPTAS